MVDLEKIEICLFDFDDTLCIHDEHGEDSPEQLVKYFSKIFRYGVDMWRNSSSSKHMRLFMRTLKSHNVHMGLIFAAGTAMQVI